MPSILGANSVTGDFITNSLCFNDGDSARLARAQANGNQDKWTWSGWVKRSNTGAAQCLFATTDGSATSFDAKFDGSDRIDVYNYLGGGFGARLITNRLFRDVAAWYHIVIVYDSGNGTEANRLRIYVNGTEESSFSTTNYPSQNEDSDLNVSGSDIEIGRQANGSQFFDGYMAEMFLLDGQAKAPTDFAETDSNGVWVPKEYTGGSFGTNGFHLQFKQTGTSANAAGIGADTSGNGNHFTPTNLAATDIGIDTPQNNYCTINSTYADDGNNMIGADFTEGNRKQLTTVDAWKFGRGTFLLEAGKWYVEVKMTETGSGQVGNFGIVPSQGGVALGESDDNAVFEGLRVGFGGSDTILQKLDTGTGSNIFTDFASGNTAMLAIDLDNNKIWVGKEGTWYNDNNASTTLDASNHDIALPTVSLGWVFGLGIYRDGSNNVTYEYNWGNPAHAISSGNSDADDHGNFEFAVPSGFFAVNSKNLAEYG